MSATASGTGSFRPAVMYAAIATACWGLSLWLSTLITVNVHFIHDVAIVLHILAMVLSFGAIMLLDWHGFLWLINKRKLGETVRLDGAAGPLIWIGMAGLLATGPFLEPNLDDMLTDIKLVAVLLLMLNGILLMPLMNKLDRMRIDTTFVGLTTGQRIHMLFCLMVSQICWWTAIAIGFINAEM